MPFTLVTWALLSGRFLYENYGFGLNISKWALKESQTRQTNFIKKKKNPLYITITDQHKDSAVTLIL